MIKKINKNSFDKKRKTKKKKNLLLLEKGQL